MNRYICRACNGTGIKRSQTFTGAWYDDGKCPHCKAKGYHTRRGPLRWFDAPYTKRETPKTIS